MTQAKKEGIGNSADHQLRARLRQANAALRHALGQVTALRDMAYRDPLTGLHNRRHFEERLAQEISRAERKPGTHFSLLIMDVNDFKGINDTLGHQAGDKALQQVANYLHASLRSHDICCRTGGDEFMVILPEASAAHCDAIAARLRQGIASIQLRGVKSISLSVGSVTWPQGGASAAALIAAADAAMYEDKRRQKSARRPARAHATRASVVLAAAS